jgi:uncharacterized membrane protein YfhO
VDGAPAPIARADYAFMAVAVPAGEHALRLEYHPTQLGRGLALAAVTLAALAVALAWRWRGARGAPATDQAVDRTRRAASSR